MRTDKKQKSFNVNIFVRIHFTNKTKSGILFLPLFTLYTFSASFYNFFNNICPKKLFIALIG